MEFKVVKRVLIANRGEIAVRIINACKKYNLTSISIYPKEDIESLHVSQADTAVQLEGTGASAYIDIDQIVQIAIDEKADVVIPGYGFLSENSTFANKLVANGIAFAGPSPESVENFGLKHLARQMAIDCGVPVVPGSDLIRDETTLVDTCESIGYPVILKATAGGGGMGLKVCHSSGEVAKSFAEVKSRGATLFSNTGVFVEKYIRNGRHIEVQVFGNGLGEVASYGERECSIQRRHQKVIEETPSPFVESLGKQYGLRKSLTACARKLASSVNYKSAGTVEFLVDDDTGEFYFLEMNTRLQVEHGITELVYGVDLVYFMLLQCEHELAGTVLDIGVLTENLQYNYEGVEIPNGHAIEVRVYAENPLRDFTPCPGRLHLVEFPDVSFTDHQLRIDHWIETGGCVSPYFDPLLAKVMVWSQTRTSDNIVRVLKDTKIMGPVNNIQYCIAILESEEFRKGETLTSFLDTFDFHPKMLEFEAGGNYTTIQDLPGRPEVRHGVPRAGPVDDLSLQLANIIVHNDRNTEGLEITVKGPTIKFHSSAIIAFAGANFPIVLNNDKTLPMFAELHIPEGSVVEVGSAVGHSSKCYMAIRGGFPGVSKYLGSKSCTPALKLGGHQGRTFVAGDCLDIAEVERVDEFKTGYALPQSFIPNYEDSEVIVRVISGPHDTPDIASEEGLQTLYSHPYSVNFNSNRGAIRLDGPAFKFERTSGGDGGGHPSNILEYPYPCCGLSTVGNIMVLFGVDGATLSGFTCVAVPASVDFRKFGQAAINGTIRFKRVSYNDAVQLMKQRNEFLELAETRPVASTAENMYLKYDSLEQYESVECVFGKTLYQREEGENMPMVSFRQGGESMIVIDFGTTEFSLFNNGRQHILAKEIERQLQGEFNSIECTSGAMAVTFDPLLVARDGLLSKLVFLEKNIPKIETLTVPSRKFTLPVCFEHSALDSCIKRYMHSQRPHAPYLPSNVEYLMRANCIETFEEFKKCIVGKAEVVTAVSFLCADPLLVSVDPRARFLTSKYNPARTSTPAGAIGSGSVSQSVYPVDSPGGYMIWGMTLPSWYWDTFGRLHGKPWPLEVFDQVVYYEVSEAELEELNTKVLTKQLKFEPEDTVFDFGQYSGFLESISRELEELQRKRKAAFEVLVEEEMTDQLLWEREKEEARLSKTDVGDLLSDPNTIQVCATIPANVFKLNFKKDDVLTAGNILAVLEAMKMEIPLKISDKVAERDNKYRIVENVVEEGDIVGPGDAVAIVVKV
ncbi:urea carboxylase [Pichia kudriavzevii]|uniref:Urea carboxylase n=1 Tax=Pichia kudriavzevii TaxID=4909 RepID=A0A1Z8JSC5_PICKU|nr:urea carboxylase [Pichia kudriavzevii]